MAMNILCTQEWLNDLKGTVISKNQVITLTAVATLHTVSAFIHGGPTIIQYCTAYTMVSTSFTPCLQTHRFHEGFDHTKLLQILNSASSYNT